MHFSEYNDPLQYELNNIPINIQYPRLREYCRCAYGANTAMRCFRSGITSAHLSRTDCIHTRCHRMDGTDQRYDVMPD